MKEVKPKSYKETRTALYFRNEVVDKFRKLCEKEKRDYSAQLEVMIDSYQESSIEITGVPCDKNACTPGNCPFAIGAEHMSWGISPKGFAYAKQNHDENHTSK